MCLNADFGQETETSPRPDVRRSLVTSPLGFRTLWVLPPNVSFHLISFANAYVKTRKGRIVKIGRNIRYESGEVRCGFWRDLYRDSNFVGEFTLKVKISYYFQNDLKICVLGNSDMNYHFHSFDTFYRVIVAFIERTRLCVKVDMWQETVCWPAYVKTGKRRIAKFGMNVP